MSEQRFAVGQRVRHFYYGEGVVVQVISPFNFEANVEVDFGHPWGIPRLLLGDDLTPIAEPEPVVGYEPAPDPEPVTADEVAAVIQGSRARIDCDQRNGHEWGRVGTDPIERCVHCGAWRPDPEPGSEFARFTEATTRLIGMVETLAVGTVHLIGGDACAMILKEAGEIRTMLGEGDARADREETRDDE